MRYKKLENLHRLAGIRSQQSFDELQQQRVHHENLLAERDQLRAYLLEYSQQRLYAGETLPTALNHQHAFSTRLLEQIGALGKPISASEIQMANLQAQHQYHSQQHKALESLRNTELLKVQREHTRREQIRSDESSRCRHSALEDIDDVAGMTGMTCMVDMVDMEGNGDRAARHRAYSREPVND